MLFELEYVHVNSTCVLGCLFFICVHVVSVRVCVFVWVCACNCISVLECVEARC